MVEAEDVLIQEQNQHELKLSEGKQEPILAIIDPKKDWEDKKGGFVELKEWEEDRKYKSTHLGKALVGMLESILERMVNSARENTSFVTYFKNYIKI
jgi:hypothetical protein